MAEAYPAALETARLRPSRSPDAPVLPPTPRTGDRLSARFDGLPADNLLIATRHPPLVDPGWVPHFIAVAVWGRP